MSDLLSPSLPFAHLLDRLRQRGFDVGVHQHIAIQRLLAHLGAELGPEDLRSHLGPLLAKTKEQQVHFHQVFDQLYPHFGSTGSNVALAPTDAADETSRTIASSWWRRKWVWMALGVTVGLAAWVWIATRPDPVVTPPPTAAPSQPIPETPQEVVARSRPPGNAFVRRNRTALRWVSILVPLGLLGLLEGATRRRRRLGLARERARRPPFRVEVGAGASAAALFGDDEFRTASTRLRTREVGDVLRLDIPATVKATITALGFPTFRYASVTRPPEYLMLIERHALRDHQAHLFGDLAEALEREGVHVEVCYFDRDPRTCFREDRSPVLLKDLRRHFPTHRVLMVGSGHELLDPVSGGIAAWVPELMTWPNRALLTSEPSASWGRRELVIAEHFVVLPATTQGLAAVVDYFDSDRVASPREWRSAGDPHRHMVQGDGSVQAIERYLGPRGFQWLCACALYPELQWGVTLRLGMLHELAGAWSDDTLTRLVRIPWFRAGAMPDEVRADLMQRLEPEIEQSARAAIIELLDGTPAPVGSVAGHRRRLEIAMQRFLMSTRDREARKQLERDIGTRSTEELEREYVFLRFLKGGTESPLLFLLPRGLRQLIYRGGVPLFGWRTGARAGTAGAFITSALLLLQPGFEGMVEVRPDVGARSLASVSTTAGGAGLNLGLPQGYAATTFLGAILAPDGTPVAGASLDWVSDNDDVVRVSGRGDNTAFLVATGVGSATIEARYQDAVIPIDVTVGAPGAGSTGAVARLDVQPGQVALAVGERFDLVAFAEDAAGNVLQTEFNWASSNPAIIQYAEDPQVPGLVTLTGQGPGRAYLVVAAGPFSDSVEVEVTAAGRITVQASPVARLFIDSVDIGDTPVANYQLPAGQHVVQVRRAGYVTVEDTVTIEPGATLPRSYRLRTASGEATVPAGRITVQASPFARLFIDGVDIGDTPVANYQLAAGQHVVQVRRDGYMTVADTVTIEPGTTLRKSYRLRAGGGEATVLAVSPEQVVLVPGATLQLEVDFFTDDGGQAPAQPLTYRSFRPDVATVSPSGLVAGVQAGNGLLEVVSESGIRTRVPVIVADTVVRALATSGNAGDTIRLAVNEAVELRVYPVNTASSPIGSAIVDWRSSDRSVVSVSPARTTGPAPESRTVTVTAGSAVGTAILTASHGTVSRDWVVVVSRRRPVGAGDSDVSTIDLRPPEAAMFVGQRFEVLATAFNSSDNVLAASFRWSSSDPDIVRVEPDDFGVATLVALAPGVATIRVAAGARDATMRVDVSEVSDTAGESEIDAVDAFDVSSLPGDTILLPSGGSAPFSVVPIDSDGAAVTSAVIRWETSNASVVVVRPTQTQGSDVASRAVQATGVGAGRATITAWYADEPVRRWSIHVIGLVVEITPDPVLLLPGERRQLSVEYLNDQGVPGGPMPTTWTVVAGRTVVAVDPTGVVEGLLTGSGMIEAEGPAGVRERVQVVVAASEWTLDRSAIELIVGEERPSSVVVPDQGGRVLRPDLFTWFSDDRSVATVTPSGVITGVGEGSTTIVVTGFGQRSNFPVGVTRGSTASPGSTCAEAGPNYNRDGTCFDDPPVPTRACVLDRPAEATGRVSATVWLRIDTRGTIAELLGVRTDNLRFRLSVRRFLQDVSFEPARKDGQLVESWIQLSCVSR